MFRFLVAAMGVAAVSAFSGPTTMTVASPVARASDVTMIGKKFGTPKKTVAKKEAPKPTSMEDLDAELTAYTSARGAEEAEAEAAAEPAAE